MKRLERREWLRACFYIMGALSFGAEVFFDPRREAQSDLAAWLLSFRSRLPERAAVLARLGAAYLRSNPRAAGPWSLMQEMRASETTPIPVWLAKRVARDFTLHDVVIADGWVLARTEAQVGALLHMMSGGPE